MIPSPALSLAIDRARSASGVLVDASRAASAVDRWLREYNGEEFDRSLGRERISHVEETEPGGVRGVARGGSLVTASNFVARRQPGAISGLPGVDVSHLRESVALALAGADRVARRRESRRERYRLRRAHQHTVDVETRERPGGRWHLLEHEGETHAKWVEGGVMHRGLSQLLCGRSAAITMPEKGSGGKGRTGTRERVEVRRRPDGSASASGTYYCGNVWCCPVCSHAVARERGAELQKVWSHLSAPVQGPPLAAYLLTLTVRHEWGSDLESARRGVAEAWRKLRAQGAFRRWLQRVGYFGDVRALEVTVGVNGWHPHLHIVFWTFAPLEGDRHQLGIEFGEFLAGAWKAVVRSELGERAVPDDVHGAQFERVRSRADYIAKLGIAAELHSHGKEARRKGSRTTWQLLADVAAHLEARGELTDDELHAAGRDFALWKEWQTGMHGAKQLTWSKGLREVRRGLVEELSDEEAAARDAEAGEVVAVVPVALWLRGEREIRGFVPAVLEAAEGGGGQAVALLVRELSSWWDSGGSGPPTWWPGNNQPAGARCNALR